MLKYLSYLNLFLGIIFIAILKSNQDYLDLALIVPTVFFNWVTLFHFIKNNLKFQKWHLYVGFLSVFFAIVSMIITLQILLGAFGANAITFGPAIYLLIIRLIFNCLTIIQFTIAFKANRNLLA